MQGFNMGRYRPYDADPRREGFNSSQGLHALGKRARKIDQGILIVRFEIPFSMWCGHCDTLIGQGVRFNAEKRQAGKYLSTPIWAFRCKCSHCQHHFEIQTDPQNTRYVVTEGGRQKVETYDPEEEGNGSFIHDTEAGTSLPSDPLALLDQRARQLSNKSTQELRIAELEDFASSRNNDPYTLNSRLRALARPARVEAERSRKADMAVRARIGWEEGRELVPDTPRGREIAHNLWEEERAKRERELYELDPVGFREAEATASLDSLIDDKQLAPRRGGAGAFVASKAASRTRVEHPFSTPRTAAMPRKPSSSRSVKAASSMKHSAKSDAIGKLTSTSSKLSTAATALARRLVTTTKRKEDPFSPSLRNSK